MSNLSPFERRPSETWLPPLEGLRGAVIIMVILYHSADGLVSNGGLQGAAKWLFAFGWTGVDLFFVLSGFLITGILLDTRNAENYFSAFYMRRILRIFPVYYVSLAVIFWLEPRLLDIPAVKHKLWYVVYAQNWMGFAVSPNEHSVAHFWSLGVEEQFYLFWPLVIFKFKPRQILQITVWGIVVSMASRIVLLEMHVSHANIFRITIARMDALLYGAAVLCLTRDKAWIGVLRRSSKFLWLAPMVVLPALRLMARPYSLNHTMIQRFGYTATALAYAALLVSLVLTIGERSALQSIFTSALLRTFGKYSYAAYIWHILVRDALARLELKYFSHPLYPGIHIPIWMLATLMVSMCSYVLVERPFLSLKRFFKPHYANAAVIPACD